MINLFKRKAYKIDKDRQVLAAKALLDTPMFQELIESLEDRYFQEWYNSNKNDTVLRETLYIKLQTIRETKDYLQNIIKSDKLFNI